MSIFNRRSLRVATIGGGHGQSVLLKALAKLECEISAVVAVSDDGGCSGFLRKEHSMPPPGDMRRCLSALAQNREMAKHFESRSRGDNGTLRSVGNQILYRLWRNDHDLQNASDAAARMLVCNGRVLPASNEPCTLSVEDLAGQQVVGETTIEHSGIRPYFLQVQDGPAANPQAVKALLKADMIFIGPGSFFTSVLAPLAVKGIGEAFIQSSAEKVLMGNLAPEGNQTSGTTIADYVQILSRHLPGQPAKCIDHYLVDVHNLDQSAGQLENGIDLYSGRFRSIEDPDQHCEYKTAREISMRFGIPYASQKRSSEALLERFAYNPA